MKKLLVFSLFLGVWATTNSSKTLAQMECIPAIEMPCPDPEPMPIPLPPSDPEPTPDPYGLCIPRHQLPDDGPTCPKNGGGWGGDGSTGGDPTPAPNPGPKPPIPSPTYGN